MIIWWHVCLNKHFSNIFGLKTLLLAAEHASAIIKVINIIHIQLLNTQGYPYFFKNISGVEPTFHTLIQVKFTILNIELVVTKCGWGELVGQETCEVIELRKQLW